MNSIQERRKFPRAEFPQAIRLQPVQASKSGNVFEVQGDSVAADGRDISEGGFKFNLHETLKPGTILKIIFKVDSLEGHDHEAYVKVVWAQKKSHGVQFLMLEESTRRRIKGFIDTDKPGA